MHHIKKHPSAGFSLVELSIVLIVIGLLIGGALKGQELLEKARLQSILTQIEQYRYAINTFNETYGHLPGDMPTANTQIQNGLPNGDGDGIIAGDGLDKDKDAGKVWQHLASVHLIPDPGAIDGDINFGAGAPQTKLGGGVTLGYNIDTHMPGLWFVVGNKHNKTGKGGLLTPKQTQYLLQKTDSTAPKRGRVQARDGENGGKCLEGALLKISNDDADCVVYFKV